MCEIYIYNGVLFSLKKEWNSVICSNMDGPKNYHIMSDKDKYMISLTCGIWNKKTQMN